jgi:hypothetical protein
VNQTTFSPADAHDDFHGVSNADFLGRSTNVITFTYQDINGCVHAVSKTIYVNPSPQIEGPAGDQIVYDAICDGFPIEAHVVIYEPGTSTEVASYAGYSFQWITPGGTFVINDDPSVVFETENLSVNVTLNVTSPDLPDGSPGCVTTITDTDAQGFPPIPTFTYVGITENSPLGLDIEFFQDNLQLDELDDEVGLNYMSFTLTGITGTTVVAPEIRTNTFSSGVPFDLSPINIMGLTAGTYEAELIMGTFDGCLISSGVRVITILPQISLGDPITGGGYQEYFDDDNGGWYIEIASGNGKNDNRKTSWKRTTLAVDGTPYNDDIGSVTGGMMVTNAPEARVYYKELDDPELPPSPSDTLGTSYYPNEISFVYTPAFDYSEYDNPALRFDYIRDFDSNRDGVVVQVSEDDGRTWTTLGDNDINSGINWYSDAGVSAGPGDQTGRSPENEAASNDDLVAFAEYDTDLAGAPAPVWKEARHQLIEGDYVNELIRYRFALGAIPGTKINIGTRTNNADGFAFDNFSIYEVNKVMLVESFSSTFSETSRQNANLIQFGSTTGPVAQENREHNIDWDAGTQGLWINYYTDMANEGSSVDPINAQNKVGPGTRATFYGITGVNTPSVPATRIAGEIAGYKLNATPEDFGNQFNAISLADADFIIEKPKPEEGTPTALNSDIYFNSSDPDVLSATVTYTATTNVPGIVEAGFYFAVVEKVRTGFTSGVYGPSDEIYYPLRVMLPGPEGAFYRGTITADQEFTYNMNWKISGIDDPDNIRVIAFVQYFNHPNANKIGSVEQAQFIDADGLGKINTLTGLEDLNISDILELYPNPADDRLTLQLADAALKPVMYKISDQSGRQIMVGRIERGIKEVTIDVSELSSGLYIIQVFNDDRVWTPKRIIIAH